MHSFTLLRSSWLWYIVQENLKAIYHMQAAYSPDYEITLRRRENMLFFKRWLKNPSQMGTLAPVTPSLARLAANLVENPSDLIVELGAGTGRVTRALLAQGVKPQNLVLVELDHELCVFLKETLKDLPECKDSMPHIIEGDATRLAEIIPESFKGNVATVVSAIPFMYIPPIAREKIVQSSFDVLKPAGSILHITYNPKSPLAFKKDLNQERVGKLWFNVPPGFVWRYQQGWPS
ncbi:MAG: methyltransferase domain-containing protein [Alphaproteobacteria bacterium]|nr:methyltransferase domain-containing protein [Alphaproteobacteria bacterium]